MIYALVEPSIYMIASILPTTRHLYRRACRKFEQLHSAYSKSSPGISNACSDSAELQHVGNSDSTSRKARQNKENWQATTNPSQEELTLEGQY